MCVLRWGWNGGNLRHKSWSNSELQHSIATDKEFQTSIGTWREQRAFATNALAALPPTSRLAKDIEAAFAQIWRGSGASATRQRQPHNRTKHGRALRYAYGKHNDTLSQSSTRGANMVHGRVAHMAPPRNAVHTFEAFRSATGFDVYGAGDVLQCGAFEVAFGEDGAIAHLQTTASDGSKQTWADADHTIGRVWYMGMDIDYFKEYVDTFVYFRC